MSRTCITLHYRLHGGIFYPIVTSMIDLNLCKTKRGVASSKIVGTELNIQILAIEGDTVFD